MKKKNTATTKKNFKPKTKVKKIPAKPVKIILLRKHAVWYVYAIECDNHSVYIGQTSDLLQRWDQHRKGQGAQWTQKYKPLQLFYAEKCKSYIAARRRERDLKKTMGRKYLKEILKESNPRGHKSIVGLLRGANLKPNMFVPEKGGKPMSTPTSELLTAGKIAQALSVPGAQVKKVIQQLGIKPAAKKGVCNYYSKNALLKVKGALK